LLEGAGNRAVTEALRGNAPLAIQRELAALDLRLVPRAGFEPPAPAGDLVAQVKPKILAWLEPQRDDIENRALFTASNFNPARFISMPVLVAMVRQHVPEANQLEPSQIARIIRDWTHVQIPEHALVQGTVADGEIEAAVQNALGTPGTVRVERKGTAWMEITAGGIEIGRNDAAPVDASVAVGWDGSIGASLSAGQVKGSFQINPDRTWSAQLAIPAGANVAVLNQLSNVFHVADRAARSVAGRVDRAGGTVHGVSVDVLRDGLGPVKDAIDTLSSITDTENRVSFGVTASGDFEGSLAVEATVTVRW
jgi:hypothetical protein